jgi:hypothetical protein
MDENYGCRRQKFGSLACTSRRRMPILPSAMLYIQQSQVPRITQWTNPTYVVLLLG